MGVPITFLDYYNPEQFELIGRLGHFSADNPADGLLIGTPTDTQTKAKEKGPVVNGRGIMLRLIIRKR